MTNYYEILGIDKNATAEGIKKAYHRLALKWHPDRQVNKSSEERKEAKEKIQKINEAYDTLSNNEKKRYYDEYGDNWECYYLRDNQPQQEVYTCAECRNTGNGENWREGMGGKMFCSLSCLKEHEERNQAPNRTHCEGCLRPVHREDTKVPRKCRMILNAVVKLELLSHWNFFTSDEKKFYFEELRKIQLHYYFHSMEDMRVHIEETIKKAKTLNEKKKNIINHKINEWIQKLKSLSGWSMLDETLQNELIEQTKNCRNAERFSYVLRRAEAEIEKIKGGPSGPPDDPPEKKSFWKIFASEIAKEANRDPKITEDDFPPELLMEWKRKARSLQGSENTPQSEALKKEILSAIRAKRKEKIAKDLVGVFRQEIIQKIWSELTKSPPVENEELNEPNWEEKINALSEIQQIKELQNKILADIRRKRVAKQQKNRLQELLDQAQQKENWDNYQKLETLLLEIKKLRASNVYQEKLVEIQAIENRLRELNPTDFTETMLSSLDSQVKANGLNEDNMDEETKAALAAAKQNPTPENLVAAEEKVCQNGADNKLKDFVSQVKNKLKTNNLSKEEKTKLTEEILTLLATENKYQKQALQKYQPELKKLLSELQGNSSKQEEVPKTPWLKMLGITVLIALPLSILAIIILRARRRRLERGKNRSVKSNQVFWP